MHHSTDAELAAHRQWLAPARLYACHTAMAAVRRRAWMIATTDAEVLGNIRVRLETASRVIASRIFQSAAGNKLIPPVRHATLPTRAPER